MILGVRVKILRCSFRIGKEGEGADSVAAGIEKVDHRVPFGVKGKAVMALHPAGDALVVSGLKMNEVSVCRLDYGVSTGRVPYGRVGNAEDPFSPKPAMLRLYSV